MAVPAIYKFLVLVLIGFALDSLADDFSRYLEREGMEQVYWGKEIYATTGARITVRFGDEFPESVKMEIQDRAYTSPIWYQP